MNLVFMGTPDFAVESLKKLYEAGHNIMAVVSQPDKPVGRGMKLVSTPTKEFALEKGIPVYQPEKVRNNAEFINELKELNPDVMVVVAYGKILPEEILNIPKHGCINVHGSLLPKYRGAAPIQWSIIKGEKETGITTMYMDKGMDTGDMLLKETIAIEKEDTYGSLYEKLKILGGNLIVKTLDAIANGAVSREKQPEEFTVAPMIFKEDCKIDWNKSAFEIRNLIRGVNPAPGAWTVLDDKVYKIWAAEEVTEELAKELPRELSKEVTEELPKELTKELTEELPKEFSQELTEQLKDKNFETNLKLQTPGTVLVSNSKEGLWISTGSGILSIKEIQAPNAKKMNILDYLRGKNIAVGSKMGN